MPYLGGRLSQKQEKFVDFYAISGNSTDAARQAGYPASVKSAAQRALYNNLGNDEGRALAVDAAITGSRQDGWKTNTMKTKRVRIAIRDVLVKAAAQPVAVNAANQDTAQGDYPVEVLTDQILELAKHQNDY